MKNKFGVIMWSVIIGSGLVGLLSGPSSPSPQSAIQDPAPVVQAIVEPQQPTPTEVQEVEEEKVQATEAKVEEKKTEVKKEEPKKVIPTSASCEEDYYRNVDGNCVHRPSDDPAGASARCRDGSYSYSQNRRGTCSGHGGVAQWY